MTDSTDADNRAAISRAVSLLIEALGQIEEVASRAEGDVKTRISDSVEDLSATIEELHLYTIGA